MTNHKTYKYSKRYGRIKAFTLSELLVVLIITTIVVGLAFSVLQLVQKQIYAIKINYTQSMDLNTLETALWIDFNRYNTITFNYDNEELQFKNVLDSVSYQFLEDKIIRTIDTFDIHLQDKILFFDGKLTTTKNIDAIKMVTDSTSQNQELFIFKQNDATIMVNSKLVE